MRPLAAGPILRFENLTLGYNRHPAVHHLRGEVAAGSLLAIVGPNGAGKSTLLKAIAGELRPLQGRIELIGVQRRQIAYLTQQATLDNSFPIVVHDFVAMGLWREIGAFGGLDRSGGGGSFDPGFNGLGFGNRLIDRVCIPQRPVAEQLEAAAGLFEQVLTLAMRLAQGFQVVLHAGQCIGQGVQLAAVRDLQLADQFCMAVAPQCLEVAGRLGQLQHPHRAAPTRARRRALRRSA